MFKYLGSKRTLLPELVGIAAAVEARSAVDMFTGTTRVAREFKRLGLEVTALDQASYSEMLARCYIELDANAVDLDEVQAELDRLNALEGRRGYFTETFCESSRFFQPQNGERIDAIRDAIEADHKDSWLYPVLMTALLLAADKVDSTTGQQMAYLKQWAPRSFNRLELKLPELLPGVGRAVRGDAEALVSQLPKVDLAYLDPPYNQHRYFTNYHIWETLVRWDAPEHYGIACKRIDSRDDETRSRFNSKGQMPAALAAVVSQVKADVVVVSHNNESWVTAGEIAEMLAATGRERVLVRDFDFKRYVGAQIGIYNPKGEKVGAVGQTRNIEHVIVAGPADRLARLG